MRNQDKFIDSLAEIVLSVPRESLKDTIIVLPNRRAGLFLRRQLVNRLESSTWLPQILSIEEAVSSWSGFKLIDNTDLIFELLKIHFSMESDNPESLATFVPYGLQMIRDFEEVDNYLVDSQAVFSFLSEAKAIERWHPDDSPLSAYEIQYLRFFKKLGDYHKKLTDFMEEQKLAYYGFMVRKLAEMSSEQLMKQLESNNIIFAGFSILTRAEEEIIAKLHEIDKATVYWNIDDYLIKETNFGKHEGGASLRDFFARKSTLEPDIMYSRLLESEKEIQFIAVSSNIGQTFALGSKLAQNSRSHESTAVIPVDEKLMVPLLHAIPTEIEQFNVTMGIPFTQGALYDLIQNLLNIAVFRQKYANRNLIPLEYLTLIVHNGFSTLFFNKSLHNDLHLFHQKLLTIGTTMISYEDLEKYAAEVSEEAKEFIHALWKLSDVNPATYLEQLYDFLIQFISINKIDFTTAKSQLLYEQLVVARQIVSRLAHLLEKITSKIDFKAIFLLFNHLTKAYSVRLTGEPINGMQIMGMLESRNLDFEEIHLLSANEDILPASMAADSLIPSDIRREFGMPTISEKQQIYAFHFFQLLSYPSKVYLYYNTEPDILGGGEMSRFLLQLKHELQRLNPQLKISEELYVQKSIPKQLKSVISFEKTDKVLQKIRAQLERGLSPSSLAMYFKCPLRFYLMKVLGIEEFRAPDDAIPMNILGTVVHNSLENLYEPYVNDIISEDILETIKANTPSMVEKVFNDEYPGGYTGHAYNKLAFEIAKRFVERVVEFELNKRINQEEIRLISLENKISHTLQFENIAVNLHGYIDRIDANIESINIIDFKTGKVEDSEVKISDFEDFKNPKREKALQLAIYTYLVNQNRAALDLPEDMPLKASVLSLRSISKGLMSMNYPDTMNLDEAIPELIKSVVETLLDSNTPISQTEKVENCQYCPFNSMCHP